MIAKCKCEDGLPWANRSHNRLRPGSLNNCCQKRPGAERDARIDQNISQGKVARPCWVCFFARPRKSMQSEEIHDEWQVYFLDLAFECWDWWWINEFLLDTHTHTQHLLFFVVSICPPSLCWIAIWILRGWTIACLYLCHRPVVKAWRRWMSF